MALSENLAASPCGCRNGGGTSLRTPACWVQGALPPLSLRLDHCHAVGIPSSATRNPLIFKVLFLELHTVLGNTTGFPGCAVVWF